MLKKAYEFANIKHLGQVRRGGKRYIEHPVRVMEILKENGVHDEVYLVSALLHDVLEDTNATEVELSDFGREVTEIVVILTRKKDEKEKMYLDRIKLNEKARLIKMADRISNLEDLPLSNDIEFMKRYYRNTKEKYIKLSRGTILEIQMMEEVARIKKIIDIKGGK